MSKYKSIFAGNIKPIVSKEVDKYLSLASLGNLKSFIPNIDTDRHYDFLTVAFNACVVNRVNRNDDVITSDTATAIYKDFIHTQINCEHDRSRIVGVVLTAGFSEFGSNLPMTEEEARATTKPYNIVLGGVIWRVANYDLAEVIESCDDPTSEHYLKISASWELGFDDWDVVVLDEASKNTEDAQFVSEEGAMAAMTDKLRCEGGNGRLGEDKRVYRRVKGTGVLPMGIGLTESPAADVKGIVVASTNEELAQAITQVGEAANTTAETLSELTELSLDDSRSAILATLQNFSSQSQNQDVKKDSIMKITSVKDITDESLKAIQATVIQDFIAEELKKASEQYSAEKAEKDNAIKAAQDKHDLLVAEHDKLKASLSSIEAELKKFKDEAEARAKQVVFDTRMNAFDEAYELTADDRKAISAQIKDLSDEAFTSVEANLNILLSAKKKGVKATTTVVASTTEPATTQQVVDTAVDNSKKDAPVVAATTEPAKASLKDRCAKAFGVEGFDIQINNIRK